MEKYESKVLEALIKLGEASAWEIEKVSGVPHGKIYSVLRSLVKEGLVEEIQREKSFEKLKS